MFLLFWSIQLCKQERGTQTIDIILSFRIAELERKQYTLFSMTWMTMNLLLLVKIVASLCYCINHSFVYILLGKLPLLLFCSPVIRFINFLIYPNFHQLTEISGSLHYQYLPYLFSPLLFDPELKVPDQLKQF